MKFKVRDNWHYCKKNRFKILFNYKKKPHNEKNFSINGKYYRAFYQCNLCDHVMAFHKFKINEIYKKDYLDLTYQNEKGVEERFKYITNLTLKKSDNKNRALRINNFFRKKKISILDVGCGTGVFLYEMKKLNHSICGIELDNRYANFLKQKKINVFTKELAKFKTTKKFDLVTFNKVLEHVYDPLEMIKNSKRLLKQKGIIYIELPDVEAKTKGKFAGEFCIDHLQIFSLNSLDQLATRSGLKTLKLERIKEPSGKNTVFGFFKKIS